LVRVEALLRQWRAFKRKQSTVRPALTQAFLEAWRQQLLAEQGDLDRPSERRRRDVATRGSTVAVIKRR
jgi:hypothetical protein